MKRDRGPIAQGVAIHYQPQCHLLKGRIILVTGASDGIGCGAALAYARYSASVILLGHNDEGLRAIAQEIEREGGLPARWFTLDLLTRTLQTYQQLTQQVSMHYSRLGGVLHNADLLGDICPMDEQKPEVWWQAMQVNVNNTLMLTQALLPLLLRSDMSSLVFTSLSVGHQGRASRGAYAVSRPVTEGMMQVPVNECQSRHLRVSCINPGDIRIGVCASAFPTEDLLKLKTPTGIMPVCPWLMGDDSHRRTGMTFDAQPGHRPEIAQ